MAKSKYESHVRSRFEEIAEWCKLGMSDKDIYANLGIGRESFYSYQRKHAEFSELIKTSRKLPVMAVKSALLKRACGYEVKEAKETLTKDGDIVELWTVKHIPPDVAACMILLKHWARDEGWTNDPAVLEVRKKELELKRELSERDNW